MALHEQAQRALAQLASPSHDEQQLVAADAGQRLECRLSALDSLGCAVVQFEITSDALQGKSIDELKNVAGALSARLTYLLEPIQPLEVDRDRCIVQMRSVPPERDASGTTYYELLVAGDGRLSLCRYARPTGGAGRQVIPAELTREVFLRLVRDFASVA